jgi:hypothetical protein
VRLSAGGRSTLVTAGQYAAASPGSLTAAKALPRNLLSDPGFELNARGWTPGDGGKGLGASPARARTGSRSLQIQGDSQTYRWASQFVRVTPGETYEISVWIWKDDVSAGGAEVKWVDAAGRIMPGPGDLPAPGPGQGWVLISDRRTVPAGAVQARLQLFSRSPSASFDDASFTAVLP